MTNKNDPDLVGLVLELHKRIRKIERFIEQYSYYDDDFRKSWEYVEDD